MAWRPLEEISDSHSVACCPHAVRLWFLDGGALLRDGPVPVFTVGEKSFKIELGGREGIGPSAEPGSLLGADSHCFRA